jgi:hypothetical protein
MAELILHLLLMTRIDLVHEHQHADHSEPTQHASAKPNLTQLRLTRLRYTIVQELFNNLLLNLEHLSLDLTDTNLDTQLQEHDPAKWFCEDISQLLLGSNKLNTDLTSCFMFSNQMKPCVNVLAMLIQHRVPDD